MSRSRVQGIERAIFGDVAQAEVDDWLDRLVSTRLSANLGEVIFRRGRVSAVFGLGLDDARRVVVKVHRGQPVHASLTAAAGSQRRLADHGYPAPFPIDGPSVLDGHVAVIESLLDVGSPADAHDPVVRMAMAASLTEQIRILADVSLPTALTERPAWAIYAGGPWPTPHDPIFDFTVTSPGFEWLDEFAQQASDVLVAAELPPVLGHSDWTAGNVLVLDGVVTAAFDWDSLVIDSEAVLVGRTAGGFTASSIAGANAPTPDEVVAFLADYETHRPTCFTAAERHVALNAAYWVLSYNARCILSFVGADSPPPTGSALAALSDHRDDYLILT